MSEIGKGWTYDDLKRKTTFLIKHLEGMSHEADSVLDGLAEIDDIAYDHGLDGKTSHLPSHLIEAKGHLFIVLAHLKEL